VYRFLATDVGAYLPGYSHCTIIHLKELISNQRRLIKSVDVKHVTLPLFTGLYFEDLLQYARNYNGGEIMEALPSIEREIHKLPREYLGCMIQSIADGDFTRHVKKQIEDRNAKLVQERDMGITMDQSILDIFNQSNAVSGKHHIYPCIASVAHTYISL
jgi:hypothetical protein